MTDVISSILLVLVGLIVGIVIMFIVNLIRKNSATNKADKILENARTEAEKIKRDYIAEAKAETNELKLKTDEEIKERKQELKESENRLITREENIDRRDENLQKRENLLAEKEQNLLDKQNDIQEQEANVEKIKEEQLALLEKISGYTKEKAQEIAKLIIAQDMSVRQTESYIAGLSKVKTVKKPTKEEIEIARHIKALEESLSSELGTKIKIVNKKNKGRIEIPYNSSEDFDRIIKLIKKK
jgi:ribonuclease Y